MLKFINLKNLTAKALIGILMVGGLVTQSDKKAVASNGVQGIELRYLDSALQCGSDPTQAEIQVKVYDTTNNTLLTTLLKDETYTTSDYDSIDNFRFEYIVNGLSCIDEGENRAVSGSQLLSKTDAVPEVGGFEGQASITDMLADLDSYEQLQLVELGSGGQYIERREWVWTGRWQGRWETERVLNTAYDLQDVVLVVDNNPETLVPDTPDPTPNPSSNAVDVELVLAVDVSSSINGTEFNIQRDGYVTAFSDQTIQDAIMALPNGVAVNMMFWASDRNEAGKVSVHDIGWYKLVRDGDEIDGLDEFIDRIRNIQRSFDRNNLQTLDGINIQNGTDLALGIREAQALIEDDVNGYVGTTKIIDISGDGLSDDTPITQTDIDYVQTYIDNNSLDIGNYLEGRTSCGRGHVGSKSLANEVDIQYVFCPPVLRARDTAVNAGITINGLPINATSENLEREDEVSDYYLFNALGGPNGAFAVDTVFNRRQFAAAATQKILGEIDPLEKPNNPPTAVDDFGETLVNQSVTIDVLDNDFDINRDSISISGINSIVDSDNNSVNLSNASYSGNNITFTSNTPGTYVITYEISDGSLTDTGKLTIEVIGYSD
jgi:hypothetical protein